MIRALLLVVAAWFLLTWAIAVGVVVGLSLASHVFASAPWSAPDPAVNLVSPGNAFRPEDAFGRVRTRAPRGSRVAPEAAAPQLPPRLVVGPGITGIASFVGPSYGPRYLALPGGRGITVRICGRAACIVRVSTDAGPDRAMQREGRVADLSWWDWQTVSGLSPARGLAPVSVVRL